MNLRSSRNKTIELTKEQIEKYSALCRKLPLNGDVSDSVILADSQKAMEELEKESFDLMIADPPYNLDKDFDGEVFSSMNREKYIEYTKNWLEKAKPLLKKTASVYVCCDWRSSAQIERALIDCGFIIRSRITWQREKGRGAKRNWKNSMEDIWFATVSDEYTFNLDSVMIRRKVMAPYRSEGMPKDWEETKDGNFRNTCPSNFWDDITVPYWSMPENTPHPTQKPEKLIARLILASSNEGDKVFDPFLGSGTTAVTAKKLSRHFVGIEKSEHYCALANYRLELAKSDISIQGYNDGVFWERNTKGNLRRNKE